MRPVVHLFALLLLVTLARPGHADVVAAASGEAHPVARATDATTLGRPMPACAGDETPLSPAEGGMFVTTLHPASTPATAASLRFMASSFGASGAYDCDPTVPFHVRAWVARGAFPATEPPTDAYAATAVAGPDGVVRVELPASLEVNVGERLFVAVRPLEVTVGAATFGSCASACPTLRPDLLMTTERRTPYVWRSLPEPLALRLEVRSDDGSEGWAQR